MCLRNIRKAAGLTQQQFADLVGLTVGSYRQAEAGRMAISKGLAERIAHDTGCGLKYPSEGICYYRDKRGRLQREEPIGVLATCGQTEKPFDRKWLERTRRLRQREARVAGVLDRLQNLEKWAVLAAVDEKFSNEDQKEFISDLMNAVFVVIKKHGKMAIAIEESVANNPEMWAETGLKIESEAQDVEDYLTKEIKKM